MTVSNSMQKVQDHCKERSSAELAAAYSVVSLEANVPLWWVMQYNVKESDTPVSIRMAWEAYEREVYRLEHGVEEMEEEEDAVEGYNYTADDFAYDAHRESGRSFG